MIAHKTVSEQIDRVRALFEDAPADLHAHSVNLLRAMGNVGLLKHAVGPVRLGLLCAAREGLAYYSGLADALLAVQGLGSFPVHVAGTAAQKRELLGPTAQGRLIAAFALTEPEAGSDAASLATEARRSGGRLVLNGRKTFVSNAGIAHYYTVFARAPKGITACLVRADDVRVRRQEAMAPHPLGEIHLDDAPAERLGEEGEGLAIAYRTLDVFRASVAAAACGLARRARDEAMKHAQARRQFGRPLVDFQAIRFTLAEIATELEAARFLVVHAARTHDDREGDLTLASSMAKLFATETAQKVVDACVQIHGGQGVLRGGVPERLYREVRALRIYEGTSEILKHLIAKRLLPES